MPVIVELPQSANATTTVTKLYSRSGTNQTSTYNFTDNYDYGIATMGGYKAPTFTGTGWTNTHSDNSSSNVAYGWIKPNVQSGEQIKIACSDRYGIAVYGVKVTVS